MTDLPGFLSKASGNCFVRGKCDCMLFVADWALALTGVDPAGPLRGAYGTVAEANDLITAAGGPAGLLDARLIPCGWVRADGAPRAGDIALVEAPGHAEPMAGVYACERRVALLAERGLVVWPLPALALWRFGGAHG